MPDSESLCRFPRSARSARSRSPFCKRERSRRAKLPATTYGRIEPGETANLNVQLTNTGAANATAISANLTTATTGVTIITPKRTYPNIAPNPSANNSIAWQFVVGSGFPFGGTINFTLTVNYSSSGTTASQTFGFNVNTVGSFSQYTFRKLRPRNGSGITRELDDRANRCCAARVVCHHRDRARHRAECRVHQRLDIGFNQQFNFRRRFRFRRRRRVFS